MCSLPTTGRKKRAKWVHWWLHWWLHVVGDGVMLTLLGCPVIAGDRMVLDNFSAYPPQPKIQLDLDNGSTCSVTDRAPPTLILHGRQLNSLDRTISPQPGFQNDIGGGIALMIPLGATGVKKKMRWPAQIARSKGQNVAGQPDAGNRSDQRR